MTDKQIQAAKAALPKWISGKKTIYTPEQKQLNKELWCREMINSILCYHGERDIMKNRYLQDYIKELGLETVQRLCDEQIADFRQAIVMRNVFTDSEGLSYSAIVWADER
jgi:hypothetical protein